MQVNFKTATQRLRADDFRISDHPPFPSTNYPSFLPKFFEELEKQQAERDVEIEGMFCHGGAHADLAVGRRPVDFDVYVSSPQWVDRFKKFWKALEYAGQSEYRELSDDRELYIEGPMFPLSNTTTSPTIYQADLLGEYFGFSGQYFDGEDIKVVDFVIGSKLVTPKDFLASQPAPIMAAAVQFDTTTRQPTFTHHNKFCSHVERKILCTDTPDDPSLQEKADRKGWTIMTPDQEAKLSFPEAIAANEPQVPVGQQHLKQQ